MSRGFESPACNAIRAMTASRRRSAARLRCRAWISAPPPSRRRALATGLGAGHLRFALAEVRDVPATLPAEAGQHDLVFTR
jgi:hypothetical protein